MSGIFYSNAGTGMETMLAFAMNALFCGSLWRWINSPSVLSGVLLGGAGLAAFLTRPESILPTSLAICIAFVIFRRNLSFKSVVVPVSVIIVGVCTYVTGCQVYFRTPLPFAFYIKAHHFYKGYSGRRLPVSRAVQFFGSCGAFSFAIIWLSKPKNLRMLAVFLLPLMSVTIYLCTVTQIMGQEARFYVPYCPYLAVPAFLMVDQLLTEGAELQVRKPLLRIFASALFFASFGGFIPRALIDKLDNVAEGPKIRYPEATRLVPADIALPTVEWSNAWRDFSDLLLAGLPHQVVAAATETGYIGAMNPNLNIIDLSGLNDRDIALKGFDMSTFLSKKPDIVWLPYMDYTYYRGLFFGSRAFMSDYVVYDNALIFSVAIRKDSPYFAQIMDGLRRVWAKEYRTYPMENYEVKAAIWDAKPVSF